MAQKSEVITLECRESCKNPVYLRWKNRLGGWNYYLFDLKQLKSIESEVPTLFRENYTYIENVNTVLSFYKKKGRFQWAVFAENIENSEIEFLQEIAISPKVQRFIRLDGNTPIFETVIVEDYTLDQDTYLSRGNISVQIRLPEIETLRNR